MAILRNAAGVAALVLFLAGINLLILRGSLFTAQVVAPLLGGVALGLLWFVLWLVSAMRQQKSGSLGMVNSIVSSLLFLGICITLYAFARRGDASWDLTQEGRQELAPQTRLILQSLTTPVDVVCFFVRAGEDRVRIAQDKTRRFLERCTQYTDILNVEFVDPQKNPERVKALNMLRVSNVGTVVLKSGTRQREIPLSDVKARLEERDFTNALLNVSRNAVPKVYFLTGHGERDITSGDAQTGGSNFVLWLRKEAHEIFRLAIPLDQPIVPEDCSVLVINGYTADLRPHEIQALDQYIDDGGRLLVLVDVLKLLESEIPMQEQLRPWLQARFGIKIGADIIVSNTTKSYKIQFLSDFEALSGLTRPAQPNPEFRGSFNAQHPITRSLDKQLFFGGIRSVSLDDDLPEGVSGAVLLRSTPDTWAETDLDAVIDNDTIAHDPHEPGGPNPVMVAVSARSNRPIGEGARMREARVVVLGDADISSNESIRRVSNQDLLLNSIAWLTENEDLIAIRPRGELDEPIVLSTSQQRFIAWTASLGMVQLVGLAGLVVFLQRRKYR